MAGVKIFGETLLTERSLSLPYFRKIATKIIFKDMAGAEISREVYLILTYLAQPILILIYLAKLISFISREAYLISILSPKAI